MRTVLIVDDEIEMLGFLAKLAAAQGWEVTTCRNGTEAVERVAGESYDLVLSDVVMEGVVGTALLDAIRAIPERELTPVVFMSSMPERRVRRLIQGDFDFLHKPFTAEQFATAARLASYRGLVGARDSASSLAPPL